MFPKVIIKCLACPILLLMHGFAMADIYAPGNQHFEKCLEEVMKIKQGMVIKVEMKKEADALVYEFDIRDEEANDWDVECDANSAKIIEIEQEVFSPHDPAFIKVKKIDLKTAKSIATSKYPGEIVEIEYEIEQDGTAVYEFDIKTDNGQEIKIEINAANGEIHEENIELWQIGYE